MDDLFIIEGDGRKRKASKHNCDQCNKEFLRRAKNTGGLQRFCSRDCVALTQNTRIKLICENCNVNFERAKNKAETPKHGFNFCSRKCKEFAQSVDGDCEAIKPAHYGNANFIYNAKNFINRTNNPACVQCDEKRVYRLLVHHIDGNRANNKSSNLEITCGSCHSARHLRLISSKWIYDSAYLTPRELIWNL